MQIASEQTHTFAPIIWTYFVRHCAVYRCCCCCSLVAPIHCLCHWKHLIICTTERKQKLKVKWKENTNASADPSSFRCVYYLWPLQCSSESCQCSTSWKMQNKKKKKKMKEMKMKKEKKHFARSSIQFAVWRRTLEFPVNTLLQFRNIVDCCCCCCVFFAVKNSDSFSSFLLSSLSLTLSPRFQLI